MFGVFVFMAVFGWLFVLIFLFSSADFDMDVDVDSVDLDVDTDLDMDAEVDTSPDLSSTGLHFLGALLSFRSLVFFAAFFGLAGLLFTWLDAGTVLAVVLAAGIGLFAAVINVKLMDYLRRTSVSSRLTDSKIAGNAAEVVLPIAAGTKGKVAVDVNGQRLYLIASPYRARSEEEFAVGDTVVIVEVNNGSALVTRMDDLS